MNFSEALDAIKRHEGVRRSGWNGRDLWIRLRKRSPGYRVLDDDETAALGFGAKGWRPYIEMKDAQDMLVPWLASQTDLLADDWELVA